MQTSVKCLLPPKPPRDCCPGGQVSKPRLLLHKGWDGDSGHLSPPAEARVQAHLAAGAGQTQATGRKADALSFHPLKENLPPPLCLYSKDCPDINPSRADFQAPN